MATPRVTISSLPDKPTASPADLLVVQDGAVTKKMTMQHLVDGTGVSTHIANATGAHAATAISTTVSGTGVVATTVQGQLGELASTRIVNGGGVSAIVVLTQAAYDALTPKVATTLYFING